MTTIEAALSRFRHAPAVRADENPFRLLSTLSDPASPTEVERAWLRERVVPDAAALWSVCRDAVLCRDVEYGQWGLRILDPGASARRTREERAERARDIRADDVVIGEFLGDQELLIIAPSETGQRRIIIAAEIDPRPDWHGAARHLGDFLDRYFDAGGNKYWETEP